MHVHNVIPKCYTHLSLCLVSVSDGRENDVQMLGHQVLLGRLAKNHSQTFIQEVLAIKQQPVSGWNKFEQH